MYQFAHPAENVRLPVHPAHSADNPRSSQTPQGGACVSRVHTCTPAWEVPNGHLAVHTGWRTPKHDGSDDRTFGVGSHDWERNENGQRTEAIERPTGDGVHRRAAGDAAARSAHPGPDDRPRPPAASGVPVQGLRPSHRRRTRAERVTAHDSGLRFTWRLIPPLAIGFCGA